MPRFVYLSAPATIVRSHLILNCSFTKRLDTTVKNSVLRTKGTLIAGKYVMTLSSIISSQEDVTATKPTQRLLKANRAAIKANSGSGNLLHPVRGISRWMARRVPKAGQATVLAVLLFFLLQLAGIYIFTRGFLLTRLAIEDKSQCTQLPTSANETVLNDSFGCWQPRSFKRAIVVIIDALRFDFAAYDKTRPRNEYYRNKLTAIDDALTHRPTQAALFEFVADPPTTTLQRLKALTTGTLPTFVDAGSNFAGSAITEDNWLAQAKANGLRIWQMGDDTWEAIYPKTFTKSYSFPSLNVWDLHTVDNGILGKLPEALEENPDGWDILITHYLGVDHCGHLNSADHPDMADKLLQMNKMLDKLMRQLDDDTVLMVFGDHGMDTKGDHGGDSAIEVQAALFVYSAREMIPKDLRRLNGVLNRLADHEPSDASMRVFIDRPDVGRHRTVPQIDLVPTISFLLGMPIPYSSLGMVIPELFLTSTMSSSHSESNTTHSPGVRLANSARLNAQQVLRYMSTYTARQPSGELADELFVSLNKKFMTAEDMYMRYIQQDGNGRPVNPEKDDEQAYEVFLAYARFLRAALSFCRKIWAQFDLPLMKTGIAILVATCLCMLQIMRRSTLSRDTVIGWYKGVLAGVVLTILAQRIRLAPIIIEAIGLNTLQLLDQIIVAAVVGFLYSFTLSCYQPTLTKTTAAIDVSTAPLWNQFVAWLPNPDEGFGWLALIGAQCSMFASNSFTVFEDRIDQALLQTYGVLSVVRAIACYRVCHKRKNNSSSSSSSNNTSQFAAVWKRWILLAVAFLLLVRLSGQTTICREEQKRCKPNFYTGSGTSASDATLIQLVASAIIVPWLIRRIFISTQSLHGVAQLWVDWGLRATLLLSACYWIMEKSSATSTSTGSHDSSSFPTLTDADLYSGTLADHSTEDGAWGMIKRSIAQFAFGLSLIVGIVGWRSNPLCMAVAKEDEPSYSTTRNGLSVRAILGINNAYGATYLVLVTMIYAALAQTQQPSGALSFAMGICHLIVIIELFNAQNTIYQSIYPNYSVSRLGQAVILGLLAQHYYFATGHQATLASIQWRVSFIGVKEMNWVVSPLLIIANTFGSYILFSIAVPLLALWRVSARKQSPQTNSIANRGTPPTYTSSIWPAIRKSAFAWSFVWTVLIVSVCAWSMNFRRHLWFGRYGRHDLCWRPLQHLSTKSYYW
ncbi:hypothetical protein BDF19DRAFT_463342 [Syncephalis fuscata]|nr:hypothetical protein BDF19DRAFT_463342 [Syncephalis fuscata]